ncbi:MAG TPA: response regulator, partial [Pilimelia sp.]|nr:response regulator [Pilimelia sp.]
MLVVDDSVVVRRLVVDALSGGPDITVVGTAANGRLAQTKIDQLRPDVVTMDIEMPEMDGIAAVRELRKRHPRLPVIMFSTLTAAGASATLDALAAGATDYVTKPANVGSVSAAMQAVREQLIPRIHALGGRRTPAPPRPMGLPAAGRAG